MCKHFYNDVFKLIFDNLYNTPVSSLNINYYYKNEMYYELTQFSSKLEGKIMSHSCTKIGIANLQISKYFNPQLWHNFRIIYYLANSHSQFKFNAVIDLIIFIVRTGIFGVTLILFSLFCFDWLKYYFNKMSLYLFMLIFSNYYFQI